MGEPDSSQPSRKGRQFEKVARSSAYIQVADQIRQKILNRSWQAGEPLPAERELAELFGVSRATIREALRHLQAQGLLMARGRTSSLLAASSETAIARFREALTHVVRLSDIPVTDLVELRLAVEGAALARAARTPIETHIEEARTALAVMTDPRVSMRAHREADVQFHLALVAASGNQGMVSTMLAIRDSIQLRLNEALEKVTHTEFRDKIDAEHRALLRAVEQGHGARAVELLRQHLEFYHT
jgi:DNA-binding FadR family transcriptional regulator